MFAAIGIGVGLLIYGVVKLLKSGSSDSDKNNSDCMELLKKCQEETDRILSEIEKQSKQTEQIITALINCQSNR